MIIDINKNRFKCEFCDGWFEIEDLYGHDEDGNEFCNHCMKDYEEEITGFWVSIDSDN